MTWLGHSTVVLEVDGRRLVTDPMLRPHHGLLRRRGEPPAGHHWSSVDAVLLSHLHHDHADLRSLRSLGTVPVLTGTENARWLRRRGLRGASPDDVPGGWYGVGGDVAVRLVRAVHHSRPMPHRPNVAHGHLVRTPTETIWCAGDTSLYDAMRHLPELAGRTHLDLAVVPIGGWGPRLSPGHLGPEEAAVACALTSARFALPVHWGTLHAPFLHRFGDWMDRPLAQFTDAVARIAPDCEVVALEPGGTWHPSSHRGSG